MTRFATVKIQAGLVFVVFILAACAPIIPISQLAEATPSLEGIKPPPATLTIDAAMQTAGIGSYCWADNPGAQKAMLCADIAGIPTSSEPLIAVDTPFVGRFRLPINDPPASLYISVMSAVNEINSSQKDVRLWEPANGWSGGLPLKSEVEYSFQEDPGLYIFELNVRWKEYGDVSYGFLVQVGGPENRLSPTSTQPPASSALTPAPVNLRLISPLTRLGKGVVTTVQPSPDGKWLAIAASLGVYLYDTADQKEIWFRQI